MWVTRVHVAIGRSSHWPYQPGWYIRSSHLLSSADENKVASHDLTFCFLSLSLSLSLYLSVFRMMIASMLMLSLVMMFVVVAHGHDIGCGTRDKTPLELASDVYEMTKWRRHHPTTHDDGRRRRLCNRCITIPVHHIVLSSTNPSDAQLIEQMRVLNDAFSNTPFTFSHASTRRPSIQQYDHANTNLLSDIGTAKSIAQEHRRGATDTLHVYWNLGACQSAVGFSRLPHSQGFYYPDGEGDPLDGIWMCANVAPGSEVYVDKGQGKVLVHEGKCMYVYVTYCRWTYTSATSLFSHTKRIHTHTHTHTHTHSRPLVRIVSYVSGWILWRHYRWWWLGGGHTGAIHTHHGLSGLRQQKLLSQFTRRVRRYSQLHGLFRRFLLLRVYQWSNRTNVCSVWYVSAKSSSNSGRMPRWIHNWCHHEVSSTPRLSSRLDWGHAASFRKQQKLVPCSKLFRMGRRWCGLRRQTNHHQSLWGHVETIPSSTTEWQSFPWQFSSLSNQQ